MHVKKLAVLFVVALIVPASAQAHISIHPNTIPAGAFATLNVRVPGEQQGAYVKKVDTLLPAGFTSVAYESVPGWSVKVIDRRLTTPVQTDDGPIDEEVSQIVWTWTGPLGQVNNNQFVDFPLSVAMPEGLAGQSLQFKTVQTYSNGQVVHWIDPSLSAEHPAPRIDITAKGGVIEDVAGEEAGPLPGQGSAAGLGFPAGPVVAAKSSDGASKGLALAALIIGALGLLAALSALAVSGRARRAMKTHAP